MTTTVQMTNPDGTPFYANLSAPSTVRVSIGEAYNLITALQEQHAFLLDTSNRSDLDAEMRDQFRKHATELERRVAEIETTIDGDKYAQWAALDAPHAFRVTGRTR